MGSFDLGTRRIGTEIIMNLQIVIAVVGAVVFGVVFTALMFTFVSKSDETEHHYR